jgi:hypothetical protein
MNAYLSLACFPEVRAALDRLAGRRLAILSNGAPKMLAAAITSSARPVPDPRSTTGPETPRSSSAMTRRTLPKC